VTTAAELAALTLALADPGLAPWTEAAPRGGLVAVSPVLFASGPITGAASGPSPPTGATALGAASPEASSRRCAEGMQLVEGTHHEYVQRICTDFRAHQCWRWYPGAVALEPRATAIAVCVDRYEWPNQKGAEPPVMMSFLEAKASCASVGKRLCTEFEWELACEGPETWPFPYGHAHEPHACNNDKPYRAYSQKRLSSKDPDVRRAETERLYQAEPSGSRPRCVSPFGVVDLVGNVEEWVATSRPEWPYESSLKGGYWAKPWSGCRGTNDSHGPLFRFYDVGFRCCAEPSSAHAPPPASTHIVE
jgi:hypothetical protein